MVVSQNLLEKTIEQVPKSVNELKPLVYFSVELSNGGENEMVEVVSPETNWDLFRSMWEQESGVMQQQ
jgi:hypothetical protein